ncbi:MAG: TonB-dependent receptor domain-containing protein [Terriglobales bacterium]
MRQSARLGLGLLLLAGVLGMVAGPAWSQEVTAAIVGTVTDPSGAPIAGAAVTATDVDRGTQWAATTNETGAYNLPRVPVGNYKVSVVAKGFQTAVHPPFTLVLNQTARIDVPMRMGQVTETVEVSGAPPILQTQSTELGTVIDARTNASLPLASRNYIQLTLLAPGVTVVNPQALTQAQSMTSSGRPYINGNREQANSFLLDGIDNQENINNEVAYQPSVDAIQEFNLITQNASAEFGQFQGGIINTTIKSGTNSLHGSVFEFFRNDKLNANSWQNGLTIGSTPNPLVQEPNGVGKKPLLRWNMFGATVGGPIVKNKLFFFADFQGQRFDHPQTTTRYQVFTDSERAGDFGQLCTEGGGTFDGAGNCTGGGTQLKNPTTAANIPFNNLATAGFTINPVAAALFASSQYPHAQINTAVGANFSGGVGNQLNNNQGDLKIDYNVSQNDHVFGRYSQFHVSNPFTQTFVLGARANPDVSEQPGQNLSLNWTHSFNASLLNDLRVGINHVRFSSGFSDLGLGDFSQGLGIAGGNDQAPGILGLNFANAGLNLGTPDIEQHFGDGTFQISEGVIWTRGRHIIHAGFQYWRMRENSAYSGNDGVLGHLNFANDQTLSDAANFWLGLVSQGARQGAGQEWGMRGATYAAYVQDDWRITSNLTLNIGLRFEDHTPWTEIHDRMVNFGLFSGDIEVAGQGGNSRALVNSYNGIGNYQPRVGFAWTPGVLGGKSVIRAAYSVSSYMEGMGSNLRMSQNRPFVPAVSSVTASDVQDGFGPPAPLCAGADLACYSGVRIFPWDPNLRPASVQQWNLSVQQQLSNDTTLQIGYVGQRGAHLVVPEIITQRILLPNSSCGTPPCTTPGPFFAGNPALRDEITGGAGTFTGLPAALATFSGSNQAYNALQAVLQRRFSNGLQGQVAYTYSKCMTDATGYFGGGWGGTQTSLPASFWQNIYDRKAEWGPCYFDQTHILSAYANYQLPFGHGKKIGGNVNRVANAIVGGWEVSPIITLHSGNAMTAGLAFFDNSGTGGAGPFGFARPDCTAAPSYPKTHLSGAQTGIQWVDPGAFVTPGVGTFGNCHNGSVRGPTLAQVDLGVHKDFAISETKGFEFRSEFINLFNHPILNAPNMLLGTTFGQITTGQGERNIQFALKFHF